jgi:hypothetical protein
VLPPDEANTRTCVMPEEPAPDAGTPCMDGDECAKGCLCPDAVTGRFSQAVHDGGDLHEINASQTPVEGGTCAELWHDVGFTCHVEDGVAVVDQVLI